MFVEGYFVLHAADIAHGFCVICYATAFLASLWAFKSKTSLAHGIAVYAASTGLAAQVTLLAVRWVVAGYLPVTGLFSTLHFFSLWVTASALYFLARYKAVTFLPSAMAMSLAALAGAQVGSKVVPPLVPSLDTPLFFIHVATSFAAYGLFAVGALIGCYRLLGLPVSSIGQDRRMIDESLYIGYILFTWCMIAGSLWAYLAWGSYWSWRIKGLWSTILWFYYSGVLHVRSRSGWQGWQVNVLAIAGFFLVLFTFLGLGLLFETSHPLT